MAPLLLFSILITFLLSLTPGFSTNPEGILIRFNFFLLFRVSSFPSFYSILWFLFLVSWKPQEKREEKSFENLFRFSVWVSISIIFLLFFSYSISIIFLGLCFIVCFLLTLLLFMVFAFRKCFACFEKQVF